MPLRETPLAELHAAAGARMVEFAGWRLPLQFASVAREAQAARSTAALFDISHMGNIRLEGVGAAAAASRVLTKDPAAIPAGCSAYALMCNQSGGIMDDLFVSVLPGASVGLVVNAVNHDKDVAWLGQHLAAGGALQLEDLSGKSFGLALQGPRAEDILRSASIQGQPPNLFATLSQMRLAGLEVLVSRTGYTGEDGFEIFGAASDGPAVWRAILESGGEHGLVPAGLAARDVLRQEMGYPLWGQDIDERTTPLEAGLGWAIDWGNEFIGRAALKASTPQRRRVGFTIQEPGVARRGAAIFLAGEHIGAVTSGTYSHNLSQAIGQGYVAICANVSAGSEAEIEVRGKLLRARIEKLPFLPKRTRTSWARAKKERP